MAAYDQLDGVDARGRLRGLLHANAVIVSDLSLPVVLRHIVESGRELVAARFAALAVMGPDGQVEEFIQVGMDDDAVQQLRASVGLPADHPLMRGVLVVPIGVREHVFGSLYLTDSLRGGFTHADEHLLTAFAATAGVAIANARLYLEAEQQRRWMTASTELTQELFAVGTERPVDAVLRHALHGAGAEMGALTTPINADQATVQAGAGDLTDLTGGIVALDQTLAGRVIRSGKPALLNDYVAEFGAPATAVPVDIGAAVSVPLLGDNARVLAALTVARVRGRPPFTDIDRDQLAVFANHAGLAMELDRVRGEHESLRRRDDHDRIAANLHDHVIQELFATGMGLEGMINGLDRDEQRVRMTGYVEALDATIRHIRTTIFALQPDRQTTDGLQQRLLDVLGEETAALGFAAGIEFSGPLDVAVPVDLADDIVAVVREALSNAARHAQARTVQVAIRLVGSTITLDVTDDGNGIGTTTRRSGLSNLRRRAEARAGTLVLTVPASGGTHLEWTAHVA